MEMSGRLYDPAVLPRRRAHHPYELKRRLGRLPNRSEIFYEETYLLSHQGSEPLIV